MTEVKNMNTISNKYSRAYKKSRLLPLQAVALLLVLLGIHACSTDDDSFALPEASFTLAEGTVLQQGATVNFVNTSANAFSYLWSFGDGQSAIGQNASHVYASPGQYTVTLEASGNGQRSLFSQAITIAGLVPETAFSVQNADNLKVGLEVVFVNETVNGLAYVWGFGDADNTSSTELNPTFTYTEPGEYTVTLTATGTGGEQAASQTITVSPNDFALYFIDNDALKLRRIDLNNPTVAEDVFDLPGFCLALAFDPVNNMFYYSDDDAQVLYRNNLTGTNEEALATGLSGPRGIALDVANNFVYVNERSADRITQVNLQNNSTSTLYSVADNANFLLPVGLAFFNGNLYATAVDFDAETVWRAADDGSGLSKIIDFTAGGFGYGLAIDGTNEKVYFDDNDGNVIRRANLDGSGVETVGTTAERVYGIAINSETGKYYWADRDGLVNVANLDGSDQEVLIDLAVDVRGLILRKEN